MSLDLVRVDDRLVHGQVVVGWGRALRVDRIVLVDDHISASPWEQEIQAMGVDGDTALLFLSVSEAASRWAALAADAARTIVLVPDVATLERLAGTTKLERVNLGGIHDAPGRLRHLPYVFLTDDELGRLRELEKSGTAISAQDVPTAAPVPLGKL